MNELKQMYNILEDMVKSAEIDDKERVLELNREYEALVPKTYHKPIKPIESRYDNCRHSCVMSVTMLSHMHKKLVTNAKQRFAKIPNPKLL